MQNNSIICISPYQPYSIDTISSEGIAIRFHPDFFCTYKHQNEVETEGVLFHNIFKPIELSQDNESKITNICSQLETEIQSKEIGQHEFLVSLLKMFLIQIIRIKKETDTNYKPLNAPTIVQEVTYLIQKHFRTTHTPKAYAELLHISPAALSKIIKKHLNKTLSQVIADKIIKEAKRELYLTNKSVKEIAIYLGYNDPYYFKKQTSVSPEQYRSTVGFNKLETMNDKKVFRCESKE